MGKAEKMEVDPFEYARYLKDKGLNSVKIHFSMEIRHPDSKARFTCKRHFHHHGTFWMSIKEAHEWEEKGLSACPCCRELQIPASEDVVDFATFKKDVADQRKVQAGLDKKQQQFVRKHGTYGLPKYHL